MNRKEILVFGKDCFGNYIETELGRLYVDSLYKDVLPGDRINLSIYEDGR